MDVTIGNKMLSFIIFMYELLFIKKKNIPSLSFPKYLIYLAFFCFLDVMRSLKKEIRS